VSNTINPKGI